MSFYYRRVPGSIEGQVEGYTIREGAMDCDALNWLDNICISKNGKRYYHMYIPTETSRKTRTPQQIAGDVLFDFYASASIGSMSYKEYCKVYNWGYEGESDEDRADRIDESKDMYKAHRRAYKALLRFAPNEALDAMNRGAEWLRTL